MFFLNGTKVVYFFNVILVALVVFCFGAGVSLESLREFLHYTGRLGLILLVLSFGSSSLNVMFNSTWSKYFLNNRRYYGIAFTVVMVVHFVAVLTLQFSEVAWFKENIALYIYVLGVIGLSASVVMGLTSNNLSVRKMGLKKWRNVHLVCGYVISVSFLYEYLVLRNEPPQWPWGIVAISLLAVRFSKKRLIARKKRSKEEARHANSL